MSHRGRLLLALVAVALVPLAVLAVGVRREMAERLTAEYERRLDSLVAVIAEDLAQQNASIRGRLASLTAVLARDNRFRMAAVVGRESERGYLLDSAGEAMRLSGLSMLQIQDEAGTILSSGHFRNEYGRLEPGLAEALVRVPESMALVQARTAEGPFLALARSDSFALAGNRFRVVGGIAVERDLLARLAREGELKVSLVYPGGVLSSERGPEAGPEVVESTRMPSLALPPYSRALVVPFIDRDGDSYRAQTASILVTRPSTPLVELRRSIDRWFLAVTAITGLAALLLAVWLSSRISRPLAELARKTEQIDLDRLNVGFDSPRHDEIGALSRLLGRMTERLQSGAARLREAERRAAIGDLARQVNHDIKNGLLPIRNVLRHLSQLARERPRELPAVFRERQQTLESGVAYLASLAANYARLTPRRERLPCNVNDAVEAVIRGAGQRRQVSLSTRLAADLPIVVSDPVSLRRILENLVANALESLESGQGQIAVETETVGAGAGAPRVRISVTDDGRGLTPEETERVFDDFYTTKEAGTGLGLSIVRRLVLDLAGTIRVESVPGGGNRFIVELPGGGTAGAAPSQVEAEPWP